MSLKRPTSRPLWAITGILVCILLPLALFSCSEPIEEVSILQEGKADLRVLYANDAGEGIQEAARFLVKALSEMTGVTFPEAQAVAKDTAPSSFSEGKLILLGHGVLNQEPLNQEEIDKLTPEAYILRGRKIGDKHILQIASKDVGGVQYGAYGFLRTQGVRYPHPGQDYIPKKADVKFKTGESQTEKPGYSLRGFHHHTQHPIPMSVYLLEPNEANLPRVREYLRWLAANRQNVLGFHMLKTVDRPTWLPYIKKISEIAKEYGVMLAITLSFADQQQNNFKLLEDITTSKEEQSKKITEGLDELLQGGLSIFVIQFGTSEFTKVRDEVALNWLDTAAKHLAAKKVRVYAWIHTEGKLKADDGKSYYFHLPERSVAEMGAYLHTTMFYDLKNPAPVYGNTSFNHQKDFFDRIYGKRPTVYFPETAWWLGFDNNLPLALPITGYSRALDILDQLGGKDIDGHVTFTTGMEWGYWKYDHYLTRVTWDRKTTWDDYLNDFGNYFGAENAAKVAEVMKGWTARQVEDLYGPFPEMIFYIAGELPQDEIGQSAGILARNPKRPFREIYDLSETDYKTWEEGQWKRLTEMEKAYNELFAKLPQANPEHPVAKKLWQELQATLQIFVWRVQHTRILYDAVRSCRQGRTDGGTGALADEAARNTAREKALSLISEAKAISQKVIAQIKTIENDVYRYPLDILATERKSLTSYPFGYLWETSTGFFWTRRDEQAEKLLKKSAGEIKDGWSEPQPTVVWRVDQKELSLTKPENPAIKTVVGSFIPTLLFALPKEEAPDGKTDPVWRIGTDHNANMLPDPDTVDTLDDGTISDKDGKPTYTVQKRLYKLLIFDKADNELGSLGLQEFQLTITLERDANNRVTAMTGGEMRCRVVLEELINIATQVAGIERDGLLILMGDLLGFDPKTPPRDFELVISLGKFEKVAPTPAPAP
ncbi:MAG: hypothetical protein H6727_12510 [Myxococcales bacterium]|nr:hypothetical protein [Myxococcales bacterium]